MFPGLFRAVIANSGSAVCDFAYQRHNIQSAYGIAELINSTINVNNTSKQDLVKFLKEVDAKEIDKTGDKFKVSSDL